MPTLYVTDPSATFDGPVGADNRAETWDQAIRRAQMRARMEKRMIYVHRRGPRESRWRKVFFASPAL